MDSIFITSDLETQELIAEFTIPGEPISKARARFTKRGSKTVAYTPQKTKDGESAVKAAFLSVTNKIGTDTNEAYAVRAHFYNGTRQRRDVDNMVKLILDGLNEVAWVDDNQVLEIAARKSFVTKAEARTTVQVFRIGDMNFPSKACLKCGTKFRTYDSWDTPHGKKYCKPECFYTHSVEKRTRTCKHCGDEFQAWGETSETIYCSVNCMSLNKRVTKTCVGCGDEFTTQKCHASKILYCSTECNVAAAKKRRSTRFPGKCGVCGGGTTRKEYVRCNPCRLKNAKLAGKPLPIGPPLSKPLRVCSVLECGAEVKSKGMCGKHYTRARRALKG